MQAELGLEFPRHLRLARAGREGLDRGQRGAEGVGGLARLAGFEEDLAAAGEPRLLPRRAGAQLVDEREGIVESAALHLDVAEREPERRHRADAAERLVQAARGLDVFRRLVRGEGAGALEEDIRVEGAGELDRAVEIGDRAAELAKLHARATAGDECLDVVGPGAQAFIERRERLARFALGEEDEAAAERRAAGRKRIDAVVIRQRRRPVLVRPVQLGAREEQFGIARFLRDLRGDCFDLLVQVAVREERCRRRPSDQRTDKKGSEFHGMVELMRRRMKRCALASAPTGSRKRSVNGQRDRPFVGNVNLLRFLVPPLVLFYGFTMLYKVSPRRKTTFREVWFAALFVTLGIDLLQRLFTIYTSNITNFNALYGTFGSVVALLLWIYLIGSIIIFGACLSAAEYEVKMSLADQSESAYAR